MRTLLFCTAYITEDLFQRYQDWYTYYKVMFPEFDLLMSHDGPLLVDRVESLFPVLINKPHIGLHNQYGEFGGWIRGFVAALKYAKANGYDRIVHLESDCYLKKGFRDKFLELVNGDGYLSSLCQRYGFMETAIQVIDPKTLDKMIAYFNNIDIFKIEGLMEPLFVKEFNPDMTKISGNRIEGWDLNQPGFGWQKEDYFAQVKFERDEKYLWVWGVKSLIDDVTLVCVDCADADRAIKAMNRCLKEVPFKSVKLLTSIKTDYKHAVTIPPIRSIDEYSKFCIQELYKYIDTEYCLVVQYDGWIVDDTKWDDTWFGYDYIGGFSRHWDGSNGRFSFAGNGGFSFRSKRLLEACAKVITVGGNGEDWLIAGNEESQNGQRPRLESLGMRFSNTDVQKKFSIDYGTYDGQFGHHKSISVSELDIEEDVKFGDCEILSALYGANGKYASAIHLVKKAISGETANISNATIGCDPIDGVVKELKIIYKNGKYSGEICFREGDNIIFPEFMKRTPRKILIDGGCYTGDTIIDFLSHKSWYDKICPKTDAYDYEIFAFDGIEYKEEWKRVLCINPDIKFFNKILGTKNEIVTFYKVYYNKGSSIVNWQNFRKEDETSVECISLPEFIVTNFNKDDYIILKMDIEGSEFDILEKMIDDKSIYYINELYVEFHRFAEKKAGHGLELLLKLKSMGIFTTIWP